MSTLLTGRRVVVTRPVDQAAELVERLRALGAEVVELPLTRIVPIGHSDEIEAALGRLDQYDIVVVTSANGAVCLADRLDAARATVSTGTRVVAVGEATATALRARGIHVDDLPAQATGAAIVAALTAGAVAGMRVLLPRARAGRPELPDGLRRAGVHVDDVAFYDTVGCDVDPAAVAAALKCTDLILTAPSGAERLAALVSDPPSLQPRIVTIGPTTSAAARALGFVVAAESADQSVSGLVNALRSLRHP
jgi:uroporphyrinogen III methyltransferase / synthase